MTCMLTLLIDDPGVPHSQHHRNFLKEHVVFKEVTLCSLMLLVHLVQDKLA